MIPMTNNIAKFVLQKRYRRIRQLKEDSKGNQKRTFEYLVSQLAQTEYGKKHGIKTNTRYAYFKKNLPLVQYESLFPEIRRMIQGERNILWPGKVSWYAKSSGTTNDKSKYIPIPYVNLRKNHIKGTKDTMSLIYSRKPDCGAFGAKNIIMGGSVSPFEENPKAMNGDISAIMTYFMPAVGRPFFGVDFKTALEEDYELKINKIVSQTAHKDIRMIGGVPTWLVVLIEKMLRHYGADHVLEIWSNLEVYIHGGVGFDPYLNQFKKYIPREDFLYHEVYNASEGYFASQIDDGREGMLLFTDNHIFYEFLPLEEWNTKNPQTIGLEEVETDKVYGLVISSSSGLWRYIVGDTIKFTSIHPYLIKVVGRLQQFINVFGEELMVCNTEKALKITCEEQGAIVREYTVAPVFMSEPGKGGHEWLIEFERKPENIEIFADRLDEVLQSLNTDYQAKRYKAMALSRLKIRSVPKKTFVNWLQSKGKFGGQHKVPRLSNDRSNVEAILDFLRSKEHSS